MPSQPMKVRPWRCTHQGDARIDRPMTNCSTKPLTTVAAITIDMIMKKRRSLLIGACRTSSANVAMSLAPKRNRCGRLSSVRHHRQPLSPGRKSGSMARMSVFATRQHQMFPVLDAVQIETASRFASGPARHFAAGERVYAGAGPAGLAAAGSAAAEGLSAIVLDERAMGGQAGASSRIENYLGFPTGISGQALAGRACNQAMKFGAEIAVPLPVLRLDCDGCVEAGDPLALELAGDRRLRAGAVIIASGARYRRPDIENLATIEGAGSSE